MNTRIAFLSLSLLASASLAPAQAQLFGPSDEQKAHEAAQDNQLSDLSGALQQTQGRVQALEERARSLTDSLSQATGTNEELRHQIDLLNQKIDQQQKDFAYRLCMVSAQQLGAGGDDQGLNCASAGSSGASSMGGNFGADAPSFRQQAFAPGAPLPPLGEEPPDNRAQGAPTRLGPQGNLAPPPGNLGSLSAEDAGQVALRPATGNQFDTAMNLLARAQYNEAKAAFRAYADANPGDTELAPQAIYWVGNINYVQHDYPNAMTAFAEQIKKYPKAPRGPDSMLKLGQSLLAMGRTQEGCTTLGAIKSKFPAASAATINLAAGARKASCR